MKKRFYFIESLLFIVVASILWVAATPIKELVFQSNADANGFTITNLAVPVRSHDAATKDYVDSVADNGVTTNASSLTAGMLADARLSSNVALRNASNNVFAGRMTVAESFTVSSIERDSGMGYSTSTTSIVAGMFTLSSGHGDSPLSGQLNIGSEIIGFNMYGDVGVGTMPNIYGPENYKLSVNGFVSASGFFGSGAGLTTNSISLSSLSSSGATSGQVPTYNGTSVVWSTPSGGGGGSGTVTSIAFSSPLTGGTITGSGTVGIPQASASTNGYLSSSDWIAFHNKLSTNGSGAGLTGIPVTALSSSGAMSGQVPTYNGTSVAWATPSGGGVVDNGIQNFRLTLASGIPVPSGDQTAKTTLYLSPYTGNRIALYYSGSWVVYASSEVSIAVPSNSNTNSDVFAYSTGSAVALEFASWTNDTTRATALTYQDGALVKSGDATRRYIGTIRTTGVSGQCEDSAQRKLIWNYYNRVVTKLNCTTSAGDYTYNSTTVRQSGGDASLFLSVVCGMQEDFIDVQRFQYIQLPAGRAINCGISKNSTTSHSVLTGLYNAGGAMNASPFISLRDSFLGFATYYPTENNNGDGAVTYRRGLADFIFNAIWRY